VTIEEPNLQAAKPSRMRVIKDQFKRLPVIFSLIGFTLLVFLAQMLSTRLLGIDLLLVFGAKINDAIAGGEYWRLVTPIFIHVDLWHFFINMYSLYAIGPVIEIYFGHRRTLVIYFLSGITGVLFSLAFSPNPSVGASGSIFGLLGAFGVFLYVHRKSFGNAARQQLRRVITVVLLNLALGLMPRIDNWGHLGGLLGGAALAWLIGPRLELLVSEEGRSNATDTRPWISIRKTVLYAAGFLIILALIIVQLIPNG
jgi:rhomboid protease GluP